MTNTRKRGAGSPAEAGEQVNKNIQAAPAMMTFLGLNMRWSGLKLWEFDEAFTPAVNLLLVLNDSVRYPVRQYFQCAGA